MKSELFLLKDSFRKSKILVVGDLMLDQYFFGQSSRQSPEADVPVITKSNEDFFLGGAANTAFNIKMLGRGKVGLCGVVGSDISGKIITELCQKAKLNFEGLYQDKNHVTTTKKRIYFKNQQLLRIDTEQSKISQRAEHYILNYIQKNINRYDLVVVSDYNKGVINAGLMKNIVNLTSKQGKKVIVDPKQDLSIYFSANYITPNLHELEKFAKISNNSLKGIIKESNDLLNRYQIENLLVTMGEKGMLFINSEFSQFIKTKKVLNADVVGAGDTVVASLSLCIAAGLNGILSSKISNEAARISVSKSGTSSVSFDELSEKITSYF